MVRKNLRYRASSSLSIFPNGENYPRIPYPYMTESGALHLPQAIHFSLWLASIEAQ